MLCPLKLESIDSSLVKDNLKDVLSFKRAKELALLKYRKEYLKEAILS